LAAFLAARDHDKDSGLFYNFSAARGLKDRKWELSWIYGRALVLPPTHHHFTSDEHSLAAALDSLGPRSQTSRHFFHNSASEPGWCWWCWRALTATINTFMKSLHCTNHHPIRIGGEWERLVTATPVLTKCRAPAG